MIDDMSNYCIITPTYRDHFKYIKEYLRTFDKYVIDKDCITIAFIINRNESAEFESIISRYKSNINITVLIFDDILLDNKIFLSPENLLLKYGRYSFQTLKKFYAMMSIESHRYFLVLDSESVWVGKTEMSKMFDEYFRKPKIWGSVIDSYRVDAFRKRIQKNIALITSCSCNYWFIENFMWFYDKEILKDMFSSYGEPINIVDKVYKSNKGFDGVFEILLYYTYIYFNIDKYKYQFLDVSDVCEKNISPYNWENYYFELGLKYAGGCGLLERFTEFLKKDNYKEFAEAIINMSMHIVRCDTYSEKDLIKDVINRCDIKILAASQDHPFAREKKIKNLLHELFSKNKYKIKRLLLKISPTYKTVQEIKNVVDNNNYLLNKMVEERGGADERKKKGVDSSKL